MTNTCHVRGSRRHLREALKMANAEDLNRLTSCALVLLGHLFLCAGAPREAANMASPAMQLASKIPDLHLQLWAAAILKGKRGTMFYKSCSACFIKEVSRVQLILEDLALPRLHKYNTGLVTVLSFLFSTNMSATFIFYILADLMYGIFCLCADLMHELSVSYNSSFRGCWCTWCTVSLVLLQILVLCSRSNQERSLLLPRSAWTSFQWPLRRYSTSCGTCAEQSRTFGCFFYFLCVKDIDSACLICLSLYAKSISLFSS